jgi:hypothetical protein
MEEKSAEFMQILCTGGFGFAKSWFQSRRRAFNLKETDIRMALGCGGGHSTYNLVRVFD